ncbi:MAG TPA: hypothetical protein VIP77_04480 [Jiangellaceae bacterium]
MTEQQKPTPPADPTPPASNSRGAKKQQSDAGVELYRGEGKDKETVTAYKPATITRLKSEGWMPVEDESA